MRCRGYLVEAGLSLNPDERQPLLSCDNALFTAEDAVALEVGLGFHRKSGVRLPL
jgi:hypothetical protein